MYKYNFEKINLSHTELFFKKFHLVKAISLFFA